MPRQHCFLLRDVQAASSSRRPAITSLFAPQGIVIGLPFRLDGYR